MLSSKIDGCVTPHKVSWHFSFLILPWKEGGGEGGQGTLCSFQVPFLARGACVLISAMEVGRGSGSLQEQKSYPAVANDMLNYGNTKAFSATRLLLLQHCTWCSPTAFCLSGVSPALLYTFNYFIVCCLYDMVNVGRVCLPLCSANALILLLMTITCGCFWYGNAPGGPPVLRPAPN